MLLIFIIVCCLLPYLIIIFLQHEGPLQVPLEVDDPLLRVDFVREVDALLQEVRGEQSEVQITQGFDPESIASRLKQQRSNEP